MNTDFKVLTKQESEAYESDHEFQCEERNESFFEGHSLELEEV